MEVGVILEVISTVGFPIAVTIALGLFVYKLWQQSVNREEKLMTEITENRLTNSKFAEIIAGYEIRLTEIETDVKDIKCSLHIDDGK